MTTSSGGVWSAVSVNDKTVYQSDATVIDGPINLAEENPELRILRGAAVTGLASPMPGSADQRGGAFVHSVKKLQDSALQNAVPFVSSGGVMSGNALDHTGNKIPPGATVVNNTEFNGASAAARNDDVKVGNGGAPASGTVWSDGTVQAGGVVSATKGTAVQDAVALSSGQGNVRDTAPVSGGVMAGLIVPHGASVVASSERGLETSIISSGHTQAVTGDESWYRRHIVQRGGTLKLSQNGNVLSAFVEGYGRIHEELFPWRPAGRLLLTDQAVSTSASIQGGYLSVNGWNARSRDAKIYNSGWEDVGYDPITKTHSGGISTRSQLSDGGQQFIYKGGTAQSALLGARGSQTVFSGGVANETQVQSAGTQIVSSGGVANHTQVQSAGLQTVSSGGIANYAQVQSAGWQVVSSGAISRRTTVSSGGRMAITSGGVASGSTVLSGGWARLDSTGIISGATIGKGGVLLAFEGGRFNGHILTAGSVSGGTVQSGGVLEIVSGGTTTGNTDTATRIASGGSLQIDAGGKLVGLATLDPGASATLHGNAGGTINLGGDGYSRLTLTGTTSPNLIITGFNGTSPTASDQIILRDIPRSEILGVDFPNDDTIRFLLTGGRVLDMHVVGGGKEPHQYDLSEGPDGSTIFSVCFLAGTLIRTPNGERAVETIRPGDLVYVYHNGRQEMQRVTWTGQHGVTSAESAGFESTQYPVRICAGAFGEGMPYKDLLLTPEHCLFIDGALVPARMLVNGRSILHDTSLKTYSYHHIETETHAVVMADGLLSETYLDTGNRYGLAPGAGCDVRVPAAGKEGASGSMAAPLDVSQAFVEPIWTRLASRAGVKRAGIERPCQTENDALPGIHLRTEAGDILCPVRVNKGGCHVFHVPVESEIVYICSPAARPSEAIGPFVDDRRQLGVLVGAITLYGPDGTSSIDVCRFLRHARGWHDANEPAQRWTNGCGVLPLGSSAGAGKRVLALQILAAAAPAEAREALA